MPIQRCVSHPYSSPSSYLSSIPRYVLLLQDLVKYTASTHRDHLQLSAALARMQDITTDLNEKKRCLRQFRRCVCVCVKYVRFCASYLLSDTPRRGRNSIAYNLSSR